MGKSNISYLDMVWNPVTGCSGKGCQAHCYARQFIKPRPAMHGYRPKVQWGPAPDPIPFSEVVFHPDRLSEPLRWKKPRVVGVGFFGDLFGDAVKIEWLAQVFKVVHQRPEHAFIFLTKQPQNIPEGQNFAETMPNAWFGTTVCGPDDLWRVEELLKVPGKKWISYEPALEAVDFRKYLFVGPEGGPEYFGSYRGWIDGIIIGCESGHGRRPMPLEWASNLVLDCKHARVSCYVKQLDINGKVSKNPAEWPEELRVQELPWR